MTEADPNPQRPQPSSGSGRRSTWTSLAILFFVVVGIGTWIGLSHIEKQTRENVGSSLSVVVGTIDDSLREWYRAERDFARRMARRPEVVSATRELLATSVTAEELTGHDAFRRLREFFSTKESSEGKLGIFLISVEERNLFSMRDSNVGLKNLIAEQRPDLLGRTLEGETVLIPPLMSDVPLDADGKRVEKGAPTMFVATPVKSLDGAIIATLTVRLDPGTAFNRILRSGRLGASGESYAFDRDGWMVSESRFDRDLIEIGLIGSGERSMLGVRIADPGRRLSAARPADSSAEDLHLTLMASGAVAGEAGLNVEGYRDYRGESVLGAWLWNPLLGIGITSEIDEREAMAVYRTTQKIVAATLAMTVLLAFALVGYLFKLEERKEVEFRLSEEKAAVEVAANAKSEFLAHMSHEIRTPLNAIIGFSQLLRRDESLDKDSRKTVGTIERSGNHLLTLINDILEMSKIEAGQLTLNLESVNLRAIAEDMREMMGLKASQQGIGFELVWDDALPDYVDIDSGKFRQIVLNLLSNAVKFTESGFVRLTFAAAEDAEIDLAPSLRVEVADSGLGISKEDQEQLFGAFFQSDSGRRQQGGTGLGLAISTKFADYLGGDLSMTSEVGKGSTFVLRLPLERSTNLHPASPGTIGGGAADSGMDITGIDLPAGRQAPKILVVEDQPANRELMDRLLGEVGFDLQFAENGREAVEQVTRWNPDFVWMDLKMPEMNGDEATRKIREQHGDELPVVALTASALTVDRDKLMAAGFSEVLMKPIKPGEVFGAMSQFLDLQYLTKDGAPSEVGDERGGLGRLADLPGSVKDELRRCIDLGDLEGIGACVQEIRSSDPGLADALDAPLANFAFASIVDALNGTEET